MSNPSPITTPASPSISGTGTRFTLPVPQYRTKDPKLQPTFETVWSLGEVSQKRSHYRFRREKLKRELALQQRRMEKQSEKEEDFSGLPDYQKIFNGSLNRDLEELNKRVSESDKQYCHELERLAALLCKDSTTSGSPQQAPPVISKDSPSSTLENEFAEFKKQFSSQQKRIDEQQKQIDEQAQRISTLDEEKNKSISAQQERATKLAEQIQSLLEEKKQLSTQQNQGSKQAQLIQTLQDEKASASKTIDALRSQLDALNTQYNSLQSRVGDLETDVTRVGEDVKTQDKKRLKLESSQASLIATKAASSDLTKLDATISKSLSLLTNRLGTNEAAHKKLKADMDRLASQRTVTNTVNGVKQEDSDLKGQLGTLTSKVTALEEDAKDVKEEVEKIQETVDSLPDPNQLEKVMIYWANNDIENSFKFPEKIMEDTQQELKNLHESISNIRESIAELRRTPVPTSMSAPASTPVSASTPAPASVPMPTPAPAPETSAELKASLMELIRNLFGQQEGEVGDLIDDLTDRISKLEGTENELEGRIKLVEDQKFHEKYTELLNLGTGLQEDLRKAGIDQAGSYGQDDVKANIGEIKEKIEAIELCSKNLDSQWSNMQTKGMAQLILADLDPYVQKHDVMIKQHDAMIRQLVQDYRQLNAEVKELISLVSSMLNPPKKRTASPANGAMANPMKRPRVELNGQQQQQQQQQQPQQQPQQQQQQQRPSPSSRHSSVGQENFQLR